MRSSAGVVFLSTFLTLSSAAAINRRAVGQNAPPLAPKLDSNLGAKVLKPINGDTFKSAANLHVRDVVDFSRLDLVSQAELIFGTPSDNGNMLLANMVLYAPDGQQIVMMENFEGLTSAVDCNGDDGSMSLTFKSKDAFNAAIEKWSVINERDEDSFLLIANHDGCGPEDQRQAYTISKITNDGVSLITTLTAETAPWSKIAGTFDMNFGTAMVAPGAASNLSSGFFGDIKDEFSDVVGKAGDIVDGVIDEVKDNVSNVVGKLVDTATNRTQNATGAAGDTVSNPIADIGSTTLDQEAIFDVSIGQQGQRFNIFTGTAPDIVLDCVDCFVSGKLKVVGSLSVINFQVQDLVLSASPQDLQSTLEIEANIETSIDSPLGLNFTKEIASFPIPGAGIVIPGIFELGAVVSYEIAVESSITGTANFTFGLVASVPNTANIVVNLANIEASNATGFGCATLDPIFEINSGSVTLDVAATSRPKITFGVDIVGIGKLEAGLNLSLPKISATLTAAFDQAGVCEQTAGASKTGFNVASNATVELDFSVNGKFGPGQILDAGTLFQATLFKLEQPLLNKCFPINIPGLNAAPAPAQARRAIGSRNYVYKRI